MNKFLAALITATACLGLSASVLGQGNPAAGQAKSALCATCHGSDGNSELAINPKLAGQSARYLVKQLQDYKSGARPGPTMAAMVLALSEQDMADIAAWYASQEVKVMGANPEAVELGAELYRAGNKDLAVAACSACHAPDGSGNALAGFPALGGQHPEYTLQQLKDFRAGVRSNDPGGMMQTTVERLTDRELEALASYISGLH